jgi:hypothetical protein
MPTPSNHRREIAGLADWRGEMLSKLRKLITQSDRGVTEEWKWAPPPGRTTG